MLPLKALLCYFLRPYHDFFTKMHAHLLISFCVFIGVTTAKPPRPLFQWPLGDTSGLSEVLFRGPSLRKSGNHCFEFGNNVKSIPYQAMKIESETTPYLSGFLNEPKSFRDLAISLFVKPEGVPRGTLLQYQADSAEKIRIVFDPFDGSAVISFRDEYDIPAGIVVADGIAVADTWSHLVVQRAYKTGRISVFANGEKLVDEDDGFQDEITLPGVGQLWVGNTDPSASEEGQQFTGFISCLQIFTEILSQADIRAAQRFCLPDHWNLDYQVSFVQTDKTSKVRCETMLPDFASKYQLITMTHLVNERDWRDLQTHFDWTDSGKTEGYFRLSADNKAPLPGTVTIGNVKAADMKTCARLCSRVSGCVSFVLTSSGTGAKQCLLYDVIPAPLMTRPNVKFYMIKERFPKSEM